MSETKMMEWYVTRLRLRDQLSLGNEPRTLMRASTDCKDRCDTERSRARTNASLYVAVVRVVVVVSAMSLSAFKRRNRASWPNVPID